MQKNKTPEKTVRHGRIQAAIWANEGEKELFRSVTFIRSYKDERGEFNSSNSFSFWDLLNIIRCSLDSMSYISTVEKDKLAA